MKQIIVLTQNVNSSYIEINHLFWLSVPVGMQSYYAKPDIVSVWAGATTAENQALQNGSVLEVSGIASYNLGTDPATMGADLINRFTIAQAQLNADTKLHFFGTYYDSVAGWTVTGVN